MKMFAMVTKQGTAASETAICSKCVNFTLIFPKVSDDIDVNVGLVDCSGNSELVCWRCGCTL